MKVLASFNPDEDLIYLTAEIVGPAGYINARLALDTGAAYTLIRSGIIEAIGYDLESITHKASIVTGSGVEAVKALVVDKMHALDQTIENHTVICHDLPEESGVDGILGLNFLKYFDIEIMYSSHTISLFRI